MIMRVGVLFSGGKDSNYALYMAKKKGFDVKCLITLEPEMDDSYMFHFPNINLTKLQSKALEIPIIYYKTKGIKEAELKDLEKAVSYAMQKYKIQGLFSGALQSKYQFDRVKAICKKYNLRCSSPLWHINPNNYMQELINNNFKVVIVGIAAEGLDEKWLGRQLDSQCLKEMSKLNIHQAFEGGEAETFVIDSPIFKKKIEVIKAEKIMENKNTGKYIIKEARLVNKNYSSSFLCL